MITFAESSKLRGCYLKGDDKSFMVDQIVAYKWSGGSGLKVRRHSDTCGPDVKDC